MNKYDFSIYILINTLLYLIKGIKKHVENLNFAINNH